MVLAFPIVWLSVPATTTKAGGKLAQLRTAVQAFASQPGRSRSGQRNDQAGDARPARRGRESAVGKSQLLQEDRRLDEPHRHARAAGQAAAELHHVLEIPSMESDLQRFGRVRRLSTIVTTTFAAAFNSCRKANATTPVTRNCCGTWVGSSARRSAARMSTCSTAACSRRMTTSTRTDRTPEERDNWLVGKEWYLEGDRRGRQQGQEPRPQEPARFLFEPSQVANELRRGDRRRRLLRKSSAGLDEGRRRMAAIRQHDH